MTCDETSALIGPYYDRELNPVQDLAVAEHLSSCDRCRAEYEVLTSLSSAISKVTRYQAPAGLIERIERNLPNRKAPAIRFDWVVAFALGAACALLFWFLGPGLARTPSLQSEIVASHVRSLLAAHLLDVPTSDRHTVRPWFTGKVDVSPSTPDLRKVGYRLLGGRLDYIGNRPVPVLVYAHGKHWVNLYGLPPSAGSSTWTQTIKGYHLIAWPQEGIEYVAISDLDPVELRTFVQDYQGGVTGPTPQ